MDRSPTDTAPTPPGIHPMTGRRQKPSRAMAKAGMTSSLITLVVSGAFKFSGAKRLHLYAGIGLLGFTAWHHLLNRPKRRHISPDRDD